MAAGLAGWQGREGGVSGNCVGSIVRAAWSSQPLGMPASAKCCLWWGWDGVEGGGGWEAGPGPR